MGAMFRWGSGGVKEYCLLTPSTAFVSRINHAERSNLLPQRPGVPP